METAQAATAVMFGSTLEGISDDTLRALQADLPTGDIDGGALATGIGVLDLLVNGGLCKSKGDAKRLVAAGGAYLNNVRVTDDKLIVTNEHRASASFMLLRSGKKDYRLIRIG